MKKAIVLGGNGFIGSNLCRCLYKHGLDVYSMDIREPDVKISGISYISGDFFDDIFLKEIIKDKDIIYHAISTVQPGDSNKKYMSGYCRDMVETIRLCSYLLETDKRLIFLSSGGTVYGRQDIQPISEEACAQPINHYGNVKLCIENTIRVFNLQMNTRMLIARISNPYGPGQDYRKGVGFIDAAMKCALNREKLEIWGEGNIIRDYIFIDDVCEMLYSLSLYNGEKEVFNLGSGIGTSQNQIVELVGKICGKINTVYKMGRSVDVEKMILDNTRIKKIYNHDIVSLEQGIQSTWEYLLLHK